MERVVSESLLDIHIDGKQPIRSGKVREIFNFESHLVMVASDRVSAFDCILPNGIPGKGEILTQISNFWFDHFESIIPNHLEKDIEALPFKKAIEGESLKRRSIIVKKCEPLAIECVVRGYLTGSGLKEYQNSGEVCGVSLPSGLKNGSKLPEPIFTPATKADVGDHDENITFEKAQDIVGNELAQRVKELSLQLYTSAHEYALSKGIIIADTKFEFGLYNGELLLIDEVLTPDSSRFWPAHCHMPGAPIQFSFDKQIVRNYLLTLDWDKTNPAPPLPQYLIENISQIYTYIFELLTH